MENKGLYFHKKTKKKKKKESKHDLKAHIQQVYDKTISSLFLNIMSAF